MGAWRLGRILCSNWLISNYLKMAIICYLLQNLLLLLNTLQIVIFPVSPPLKKVQWVTLLPSLNNVISLSSRFQCLLHFTFITNKMLARTLNILTFCQYCLLLCSVSTKISVSLMVVKTLCVSASKYHQSTELYGGALLIDASDFMRLKIVLY